MLEERYADGDETRLPGLAVELLNTGVSIIVATSQPSIAAAARVAKDVPVIGRMVDDPIANGMARSMARPGGNVTGIYTMTEEMNPKRLALLKEVAERYLLGCLGRCRYCCCGGPSRGNFRSFAGVICPDLFCFVRLRRSSNHR